MAMMMTEKDKEAYEYIKQYFLFHGYAPSTREICIGLGLKSTSTAANRVMRLLELGLLVTDHIDAPRTLGIPEFMKILNRRYKNNE